MQPGILSKKLLLLFRKGYLQIKKSLGGNNHLLNPPQSSSITISTTLSPHLDNIARRLEGKLLLREEIPLSDSHFQQLITNHYITSVPAVQKHFLRFSCTRCQNKDRHLFALMPCGRCNQTHVYCRHCIEMGRCMSCEQLYYWTGPKYEWEQHDSPCTWLGKLNNAQELGAERIKDAILTRKKLITWAVTGAGKTEMLFPGISLALQEGMRVCIASPRADVIRELLPRFQTAFRDVSIQALYSGSRDNDGTAQLILSTTHQLYRYRHAFDVLVIDEVDAFPYHKEKSLQLAADRAQKDRSALISLTATPRSHQLKQINSKQAELVFVPIRFHGHPLIMPKWVMVPKLQKALLQSILPKQMDSWLKCRQDKTRQLLIFVPTIHLAKQLEHAVCQLLIKHQTIKTPNQITNVHAEDTDREEKIAFFRQKKFKALITTTILERGVTFPSVDVLVLDAGHQVFDDAALIQITGRAGRSPKDPNGEVVFFHDGLTDSIVKANQSIEAMNKRRHKLLKQGGKL